MDKHIFLIGFMGVGKTTVSHKLRDKLQVKELDTDAVIAEQEGKSISAIFAEEGEEYFRSLETKLLDALAEMEPCVVSCGGGMAMREINVKKMKSCGTVVFLAAKPETIYEHVKHSTNRPLLNGNMNIPYITELMKQREPKYQAAADVTVWTDGLSPVKAADKIIESILP